jgi:hypothetical protein
MSRRVVLIAGLAEKSLGCVSVCALLDVLSSYPRATISVEKRTRRAGMASCALNELVHSGGQFACVNELPILAEGEVLIR